MTTVDYGKTNWSQSVGGVCIKDGKVLLARQTYGKGKGMLIIPGGYVDFGEIPEETLAREFREETGVSVKAGRLIGIRFSAKDWYAVFEADYIEGEAKSDGEENDLVVWMDVDDAMKDETVPELTKKMIQCAISGKGFELIPYDSKTDGRRLYSL